MAIYEKLRCCGELAPVARIYRREYDCGKSSFKAFGFECSNCGAVVLDNGTILVNNDMFTRIMKKTAKLSMKLGTCLQEIHKLRESIMKEGS